MYSYANVSVTSCVRRRDHADQVSQVAHFPSLLTFVETFAKKCSWQFNQDYEYVKHTSTVQSLRVEEQVSTSHLGYLSLTVVG